MKWVFFLLIISLILLFSGAEAQEDLTAFRADDRTTFNFPSDWKWQEIKMSYNWMKAYLFGDPNTAGLYAIVMIVDNPVMQIPDSDILNELQETLMKDYPDFIQTGTTEYGSDTRRPYFSISYWDNQQTREKLNLILAGSKKTIVYLWFAYPNEDIMNLYQEEMNQFFSSLEIL